MPVALCTLLMRYETADLNERIMTPNEHRLTLIFKSVLIEAQQCCLCTVGSSLGARCVRFIIGNMTAEIPVSTAPFFQEYNFSMLDADQHSALIIGRLLAYGNRNEVRWLFKTYGKAKLVQWVKQDGARLLPKRRYNLWCVLFDIIDAHEKKQTVWNY